LLLVLEFSAIMRTRVSAHFDQAKDSISIGLIGLWEIARLFPKGKLGNSGSESLSNHAGGIPGCCVPLFDSTAGYGDNALAVLAERCANDPTRMAD
jgi:hypothetical protein